MSKKFLRLILADDDPNVFFFLDYTLRSAGIEHEIRHFVDGERLLDFLNPSGGWQQNSFDCLLLDLKMPVKSGRETLEEIRARQLAADIPVAVLSYASYPPDVEAMMKLGAAAFWEKPANLEEYGLLIKKILTLASDFSAARSSF